MTNKHNLTRRDFIKYSCCSTGLTIMGLQLPLPIAAAPCDVLEFKLLTLHKDNSLTLYNSRTEMGQGVMTSLSQLLLEDLDADWSQIREVKQSWADAERFGHQNTIGAISSLIGWNSHRQAGAKINLLLRETAAKHWVITLQEVKTDKGKLYNLKTGHSLTFGQLIDKIDDSSLPEKVELKTASDFKLIGKSQPRLDLPDKINGKAKFGIDQQLPGMKIAVVARCPVFGGKLKDFNAVAASKVKGVHKVFAVASGVAVVADNYWQASKARNLLNIEWDKGDFVKVSDSSLLYMFKQQLTKTGKKVADIGNTEAELQQDNASLLTEFQFPLVAHMTMEPMNCTAWFKGDSCEIWAPTQNPQDAHTSVANTLGLDKSKIRVNVTLTGGGFGRRAQDDFVVEACEVARKLPYPVKVIWSREDDISHDYYRPANLQQIRVSLKQGKIHAWQHKVATLSTSPYHFSLGQRDKDAGDWVAYGGAEKSLYAIPHFQAQTQLTKTPMSVGILRGISHGYINFAAEATIDHLAEKTHRDPISFRLEHIQEPRAREVLMLLRDVINKEHLSSNQFVGMAFGHEKASQGHYQYYNAAAAVVDNSQPVPKLLKIILVLDHGQVINPDGLLAQAQGSVIYALSMMFHKSLSLQGGEIQQSNFHDYPVARMGEEVEVILHTVDTHEWPMGTGEKLQGTIQPAIANALYRASGVRITHIPIDLSKLDA